MYGFRSWRREALAKLFADPISICDERKTLADALLQRMNEAVAPTSVRKTFDEIPVINLDCDGVRHRLDSHCTAAKHVRSDRAVGRGVCQPRPTLEASPLIRTGVRRRPTSTAATSMTTYLLLRLDAFHGVWRAVQVQSSTERTMHRVASVARSRNSRCICPTSRHAGTEKIHSITRISAGLRWRKWSTQYRLRIALYIGSMQERVPGVGLRGPWHVTLI